PPWRAKPSPVRSPPSTSPANGASGWRTPYGRSSTRPNSPSFPEKTPFPMKRRTFLKSSASLAALRASPSLFASPYQKPDFPLGKAESCIMLWLGGGPAQVDTFDPKPLGDPATRKAGSAYKAIDTAVPGVQV